MTDTLERREAIARVERVETVPIDHPFSDAETPPIWRVLVGGYCADFEFEQAARNFAGAINAALTTSPRIEPIFAATTWSGSATIGEPATPKVDSAFSISRRRHEEKSTPSPRVDEGRALRREGIVAFSADIENPRVLKLHFDQNVTSAHRSLILDAINARRAALATTPADPRVGKVEAGLEELVERLSALSHAAYEYAGNYLLDERDDPDLCRSYPNQHERIVALFDMIEEAEGTLAKFKAGSRI